MKERKIKLGKCTITIFRPNYFALRYSKCGYFDARPSIDIFLYFIGVIIHLPWYNKGWENECDPPEYGIAIHDSTFWIYLGGKGNMKGGNKWWTWDLPFFSKVFYGDYILGKDGQWINIKNRHYYYDKVGYLSWDKGNTVSDEESPAMTYYGKWIDHYDNTIIDAKYRVELRQWRPKWLTWTKLFQEEIKSIDVCFKNEVGSKKGSWKGGVVGSGCNFEPCDMNLPELCFIRMNREKRW